MASSIQITMAELRLLASRVIHVMPVTEIAIEEPKTPFVWRDYFLAFLAVESK
jgi:hypothetical protein